MDLERSVSNCGSGFRDGVRIRSESRGKASGSWLLVAYRFSHSVAFVWNGVWVIMANPPDTARRLISVVIGALAGAIIAFGATELLHAQPKPPDKELRLMSDKPPISPAPAENSGINAPNNQGIVTQGQSGGTNIVNQAPPKLKFTDSLGAELLNAIPTGALTIQATGSTADQTVGREIKEFLERNGYTVTIRYSGMLMPPPDQQLLYHPESRVLIVSPSTR